MVTEIVLIAGVAVVVLLPLVHRIRQRRFDPFEPIVVFALAWGVMFVVRPSAILIRDDTGFYGIDIASSLDLAVLLALTGAVGFVVGYELSLGRRVAARLPAPPASFVPSVVLRRAVGFGVAGTLSLLVLLLAADGRHGLTVYLGGRSAELDALLDGSTLYLWWAGLLTLPAALAAVVVAFETRTAPSIGIAAALTALALFRLVPTGSRTFLLVFIGGVIVFVYAARGRRPGPVALTVCLAVGLFGSFFLLNFRDPETRGGVGGTAARALDAPVRLVNPLIKGPDAEMAPALAGALQAVPSRFGYAYGGTIFGDLLRRPVPRSLWADKPEPPGNQLVAVVWPVARELGNFDPAFTPLLFLFWDFGVVGVLVGMALYGLAARVVLEVYNRDRASSIAQALFASGTLYLVIALRFDPVFALVHWMIIFVPLLAIFRPKPVARRAEAAPSGAPAPGTAR